MGAVPAVGVGVGVWPDELCASAVPDRPMDSAAAIA
jgi:hypothetical protein